MNIAENNFKHNRKCRVCGNEKLYKFLQLGPTPLANSFLEKNQLEKVEDFYPLDVYFCNNCYLIQLLDVVSPEIMFKEYPYLTGASKPMHVHFTDLAKDAFDHYTINKDSLIIDIGSNDGTLLKCFSKFDLHVLGIEPASNIARLAEANGIPTVNEFFNENCVMNIYKEYGCADIITATNVFAHADNLENILNGVNCLLSKNGVFIIEVPYILNLLNNAEFDTIYHEHLSYFGVHPLSYLFHKFNMEIVNVKKIPVHGGSIRVFVQKLPANRSQNVTNFLSLEKETMLDSLGTYMKFAERVVLIRERLVKLLKKLKKDGGRLTGYGATAKGNTLLNYCKIDTDILDYISDTTPYKQGHYTPGMHIPIFSEEKFHEDLPDYSLLLAWNYLDAILQKEREYVKNGGKFILPIPDPKVI